MMRAFRDLNIPIERIIPVINRSGAKFKEAIELKDFERVCGTSVRYHLSNDIKTVTAAEGAARTVMEIDTSPLAADISRLARGLAGLTPEPVAGRPGHGPAAGLFSLLKKRLE